MLLGLLGLRMAENTIPLLPPTSESGGAGGARDQQEFDILKRDSELKRLEHRDKSQRYTIKWIAVVAGVVVILCMFGILAHMFHHVFWGPIIFTSPALSVAMVVSPIVSITTITVAIFIGAFRKFDDKDLETFGNGTMGAINAFKSGS